MRRPDDLSDAIAQCEAYFKVLGLGWDDPRVQSWLRRCGFASKHYITADGYSALVRHLQRLLEQTQSTCKRS